MTNKEILKKANLKMTKNRLTILDCLMGEKNHFHSISEILEHKSHLNSKSVYNTVKVLVKNNVLDSYVIKGMPKYAINDHLENHLKIHTIDTNSNISHVSISPAIFNKIKKELINKGIKPNEIKIFVEIE
ncbi:MAG: transcriptional repressor [Mollicutes bacterium PWAP]|nr:transcriptional repressor [Mollicutes bacterium PWAP]